MKNWLVIEGTDFSGKSTLCSSVNDMLLSFGQTSITFQHPGATEVGKIMRSVVKSISDLDWLTEQLLPCTDYADFTAKAANIQESNIISDRISLITGPCFAFTKSASIANIKLLYDTMTALTANNPTNFMKRTLVLLDTPPDNIIEERMANRDKIAVVDHFDNRKQIRILYRILFQAVNMNIDALTINPDDTHDQKVTIDFNSPSAELVKQVLIPTVKSFFHKILLVKQPFDVLKTARVITDTLMSKSLT